MKRTLISGIFTIVSLSLAAQEEDLLGLIEEDQEEQVEYVEAAFKTNRIVNTHSVENLSEGVLDFKISHRFGELDQGLYDLFGLDRATIRLGLDYGITDRLTVGAGRSSLQKTYDGFVKYKFLRQSEGARNMPVSMVWVSSVAVNTLEWADPDRTNYFTSRLYYSHQLLIGSKVTDGLSVQLTPSLIHRNLVATSDESNDVFALGIGARQKLTSRISINVDYYYAMMDQLREGLHQSLAIGFDIETGGHVFQLHFTNSTSMIEKGFITETQNDWTEGEIHFGFNISRVFTIKKPAEFRKSKAERRAEKAKQ